MLLHSKHQLIYRAYVLSDVLALMVAFLGATAIASQIESGLTLAEFLSPRYSIVNVLVFVGMVGLWLLSYAWTDLYQPRQPRADLVSEAATIGKASGIGCVIFAAAGVFFHFSLLTPLFFSVFFPSATFVDLVLRRITLRSLSSVNLGDQNKRNVVIVGTNEDAIEYGETINTNEELGYRLLGFLDDMVYSSEAKRIAYLGKLGDFPALLKRAIVDEVVIVMPIHSSREEINKLIFVANEMGIAVRFPAIQLLKEISHHKLYRVRAETMPGRVRAPNLDVVIYSGYQIGWPYLMKRLLDYLASVVLIVLTAPVMLLAALSIMLGSGRPVLFTQERYGYNSRIFQLYKFRTMVKDAENLQEVLRARNERDGPAFKLRKDPRVTAVGRWLRRTNIDELPQLFNVLKGSMSLVGPRPISLVDYARIDGMSQRRRLSVLPGITGTWQISPHREKLSFEDWMRMDLEYIDNWTLEMDLVILAKSVLVVLFGKGDR